MKYQQDYESFKDVFVSLGELNKESSLQLLQSFVIFLLQGFEDVENLQQLVACFVKLLAFARKRDKNDVPSTSSTQ